MSSTVKPALHVGKIQHGGNPFTSLGLDWCGRCRLVVDTDTEAHHRDGLYSYRRWCLRCGQVIKYGAFQTPLISREALPPKIVQWVTRPERDRR